jgi:hypothetical protein
MKNNRLSVKERGKRILFQPYNDPDDYRLVDSCEPTAHS